jgi:hemoglobin
MTATARNPINPYELLGGEVALRQLVDRFYAIMDEAPGARSIRAMHAPDLTPMRERLFDFMSGWLGGPARYAPRADGRCIVSAHQPFAIGSAEAEQWIHCMAQALQDVGASAEVQQLLLPALRRAADSLRNG